MDKKIKSCGGRPAGRVKTAKIEITIEPEIKDEFMEILRTEGKKASSEICIWIREYIKTKTVKEWQGRVPDLSKIPCIFLLYK